MRKDSWINAEGARASASGLLGLINQLRNTFLGGGGSLLLIAGVVAFLLLLLYATCTKYVKPNEFGIMQVDVSPAGMLGKQGIHSNLYEAGIHFQVPGLQKIHIFPKELLVLTLKSDEASPEANTKSVRYSNPAHIQTSDGFFIDLDVSIIYRIVDPYRVITTIGGGKLYEDNGILPKAEPILKETMGKLKPEDFFNSILRFEKQVEARSILNGLLLEKGIRVEHVLVRYPKYHPDVQARIEGRNLQEQTRFANIAKAAEAAADSQLKRIVEEGKAAVTIRLTNGLNYVTRKRAEMEAYERIKKSGANKLTKLAEAEKTRLVNESYQGIGSDRLVGIEMADVLKGLDTIIVPAGGENGFNPLDMPSMLKAFQIGKIEGGVK